MNDYRPLLSNVAALIEAAITRVDLEYDLEGYSKEDLENMLEELNDLFAEMDDEHS